MTEDKVKRQRVQTLIVEVFSIPDKIERLQTRRGKPMDEITSLQPKKQSKDST